MLSVKFPQVHAHISKEFHGGLLPLKFVEDHKIRLVIKAPKEMLLAAKVRKHFRIFVVPIEEDNVVSFSLVTAFYDNDVHPLTITTPLFDEPLTEIYREMLLGDKVDVHFFDENNIEFLAYEAKIECNDFVKTRISAANFSPFSKTAAKRVIQKIEDWYIYSEQKDEADAILFTLNQALFPDDFLIIDARPSSSLYVSDSEIHVNRLERTEPGAYQERDIAAIFARIFPSHQIYLNPLRHYDQEEICDLLIIGQDHILFVQAKDSPNTEKVLQNSIDRKKSTTAKHLDKGLRQVEGAVKYALKANQMEFLIGKRKFSVAVDKSTIYGLVVTKELFLDEYEDYTSMTMKVFEEVKRPCIPLEYKELHSYTMNLKNEQKFFEALDTVFSIGKESSIFPRLRFGLAD